MGDIIANSVNLSENTITFGKYKNVTLDIVLRDRSYCSWLIEQEWFQNNYEFLYNRVKEYDPTAYFLLDGKGDDFLDNYKYFNLTPPSILQLPLTESDKKCYVYYLRMIKELRDKIIVRVDEDNPYDIKAPTRWLKRFENEVELKRETFKEFLYAYELPNIPYIVEDIKKEGGLEYKGAQSFNIAKKRSIDQETYWEGILKEKYGEDIGAQFVFNSCIFDFIIISKQLIIEAKLGLKDFNLKQYDKYRKALEKYRIIYLIGKDAVIVIEEQVIYTTDVDKYTTYQFGILSSKYTGKFDNEIRNYTIVHVDDLSTLFTKDI